MRPTNWPEWLTPLTPFLDSDGDLCVFLGVGGYRDLKTVSLLADGDRIGTVEKAEFYPCDAPIIAYRYKREWFFRHANAEEAEGWTPYTGDSGHCWAPPKYGTDQGERRPACPECGSVILPSEGRETEHGAESRCVACGEFSPRREWGFLD